jgi:hypothetical protein
VISGSSQVIDILSSLNSFSASNGNTSLNSYTGSNDTTNTTQNTRLSRIEESTSSLNVFSASQNTKDSTLALYTASVDSKFTTLQTLTASMQAQVARLQESTASLNAFSASENTKSETLRLYTASVDTKFSTLATYTGSNDTTNTTQNTRLSRLEESTASLNAFSASQLVKDSTLALYTASVDTKFSTLQTLTASMAAQVSRLQESTASLNAFTNSFNSAIQLTGSNVNIAGNLTIAGTTTTVNSTNVAIADSVIELNYGGAVIRGGILVKDGTGGSNVSGSLLWDGTNDQWIAGVSGSESKILRAGSDGVISGSSQVNYTQLSGISANIISASTDSSNVDFIISGGSITANLFGGVVSGSAQVVGILTSLNEFSASENAKSATLATFTSSLATTYEGRATAAKTIFSGSSQVVGSAITTNTITIGSTSTALGGTSTTLAGLTSVSSTGFTGALTGNASTATTLATARTINGTSFNGSTDITIANLVSASAQIDATATTNFATGVKTQLNSNTVVSSSSQIAIASVSGYDANRWVDHTAVSISAGNGLSGGGTIAATRTLSLDTTSATFTTGVTTQNNALAVVSGSRTISGIALGSNLATLTIGTGLSGTSYNGSTGVTIANTGVLSVTTNTGLSSNVSATGNVTITNTGVTSAVGTSNQISVSGATGAVTFSLPQSIATSSNVQFNSLGIGGAASGTAGRIDAWGDIVAFSTSDKNFKENITPIPNALEKISRISGNTYDWKVDMKEFHGFEGNDVGVIAQEIEEVLPQLVTTRENGYKAVKYDKLVALLIEGIKEQQTQIHSLTIEIEKLKESKGL